jgi:hypothetical protein
MLQPLHRHIWCGWHGHWVTPATVAVTPSANQMSRVTALYAPFSLRRVWTVQQLTVNRDRLPRYLCTNVKGLLLFLFFPSFRSKYNNVISFSLKILFRVLAHCSKDRLWRPTAFDDMWCELIEPAEPLIRVCLLEWHPITLPYSSCILALFVALPNVDALDPQPPSASLLCLKPCWDACDQTFYADQGLRLTTQLPY